MASKNVSDMYIYTCLIPQSLVGHVDTHCGTAESAHHCMWTGYREMLPDNHGKNLI